MIHRVPMIVSASRGRGFRPTPGGGGGIEPFFSDDFTSYSLGAEADGGGNGFAWAQGNGNIQPIVVDWQGRRAMRFWFSPNDPGQFPGGDTKGWTEKRMNFGRNAPEVTVRFLVWFPDGTEGLCPAYFHPPSGAAPGSGPTNNKFFDIWADLYEQELYGWSLEPCSPPGHVDGGDEISGISSSWQSSWVDPTGVNGPPTSGMDYWDEYGTYLAGYAYPRGADEAFIRPGSDLGRWVEVVLHQKLASDLSTADGEYTAMRDGVVVQGRRNLPMGNNVSRNYFRNAYLFGDTNAYAWGFENMYIHLANFEIFEGKAAGVP